jgi:hypothetical protein
VKLRAAFVLSLCAFVVALRATAAAEWSPPDLRATNASLADVLAAYTGATGTPEAGFAQRHERWTYATGTRRLAVDVAVKGDDFRATYELAKGQHYSGGRVAGRRWRADANGAAHATLSDDQGDAADRLPQSVFSFAAADCALAGESTRFGAAWILVDRPARDKPHWFYVDKSSGLILHEIVREGARTIVTAFERFEPVAGVRRPRHWRVDDGNGAHALDVDVDSMTLDAVDTVDVAISQDRRTFAPASPPPNGVIRLPATFRDRTIVVDVGIDGHHDGFLLDTGTASITLDRDAAARYGLDPFLEHATVRRLTVGPLALADASTLAIPFHVERGVAGILGYDFFLGHVVHVSYADSRVEVLTPDAAAPAFADPQARIIDGYFDEGIPLVHAAFGSAAGDRFALDTGSPHLLVLAPFARRYRAEIDARWSLLALGRTADEEYLEGSIRVATRRAAAFSLAGVRFTDILVGVEERNDRPDAIDIPLDGIIGTEQMAFYDWWFDYDNGRIAVRRNNVRHAEARNGRV